MVSYQRWTSIVFDVARQKGADTGSEQTDIIRTAASVWNENEALKTATVAEARTVAKQSVQVR